MLATDRTTQATSRLYSKFRNHADTQALATLIGTRWQEIENTIVGIDAAWRTMSTTTPSAAQNDALTKLASIVGYTRGSSETDQSVVTWATRWGATIASWGNLADILYCASAVFTTPHALAANETGPAPSGVYNGTMQCYIENTTFDAAVTDVALINKMLELIYQIAEAGSTVSIGFNLTQINYANNGTSAPPIPRLAGALFRFDGAGGGRFDTGGMFAAIDKPTRT